MRRIFFLWTLFCVLATQAQEFVGTDSLTSSPYEQGEYILENLDKTEMETSFLLDKGLQMVDFNNHN